MPREVRRRIVEPEELEALAHPLRLDLLSHLMDTGPATASACARAVGDTPSNCSYHLRVLARVGLVAEVSSEDGRERPWRALVTGIDDVPEGGEPLSAAQREVIAVSVQRDQRLLREYLARRDQEPRAWREAELAHAYALRLTAEELSRLKAALDALIRPYIAATRARPPRGAQLVHLNMHGFRLPVS